jgi:2-polyprenyl-3-methyl-5-hydroxy-6-metoxy-1,4-benzoquinol methylase
VEHFDDPVAAYDRLSAHYADQTRRRELHLRGVEREIVSRIPAASQSLLDVGAGDGTRSLRIASKWGIERVVLVEPSHGMAGEAAKHAEIWPVRAEDLDPGTDQNVSPPAISERFDVVLCLWNVLGHVPTPEKRLRTLRAIAHLLAPQGKLYLDVNHRYNLRSYGIAPTSARWIRDLVSPSENNGDVLAKWKAGEASISTYGHVFTHREITRLADAAGLEMEERVIVDYESGRTRRFAVQGNLLYIFRRHPRIESSSAPQTS